MKEHQRIIQIIFFTLLLGGFSLLLFFVIEPYLSALFLALIFAVIFYPVHEYLQNKLRFNDIWASVVSLLAFIIVIMLPLSIVGILLFQEAIEATTTLSEGGGFIQYLNDKLVSLETYIQSIAPDLEVNFSMQSAFAGVSAWITQNVSGIFSSFATGLINLLIMLFGLFFFLKDGKRLRETIVSWSPLQDMHDENILEKMVVAVNSVIKGSLIIAAIQGFLAGIGFAIFGVPAPIMWGFIATVAALIPAVGTSIVWIPMVIWLYVTGATIPALGLLLWSAFIVGIIDNILRPILIERGVKVHPFLILLSVFGGLHFFGPIGFLYGPILLSFVSSLIEILPSIVGLEKKHAKK